MKVWWCVKIEIWNRQGWETGWTCFPSNLDSVLVHPLFFPETPIVASSLLEQLRTYFDDAAVCLVELVELIILATGLCHLFNCHCTSIPVHPT